MVLPKETIHLGANPFCCNTKLELEVLQTCGYYVGTKCKNVINHIPEKRNILLQKNKQRSL